MISKGSYILLISLDAETRIPVGKLGEFEFLPGFYLYCGSALNGLSQRIDRHVSVNKKLHWHIDYLLLCARLDEVWAVFSSQRLECSLAQSILTLPGAMVPVAGFGSSDCKCRTHLVRICRKPEMAELQKIVGPEITLERLAIPEGDRNRDRRLPLNY